MQRVRIWIYRWRRHWQSAFSASTASRMPAMARHHRSALWWMLRHPIDASRT